MCVYLCMPGACGGQKRMSDVLELELHTVMRCHVGSGNEFSSSGRTASDVNC